jgi:hypothetical protein
MISHIEQLPWLVTDRRERMKRSSTLRLGMALAMAVGVLAVPASAGAYWEQSDTGSTDSYEVTEPGVVCKFENNPGFTDDELDAITVKAINNVHHPSSSLRKVGVRAIFQRNRPPHGDDVFTTYGSSAWQYKMADNNTHPKTFGPWTLKVPEDPIALWRVQIQIRYYAANGSTVIGESRGTIEVYRHKSPYSTNHYTIGQDFGDGSDIGWCREEFS